MKTRKFTVSHVTIFLAIVFLLSLTSVTNFSMAAETLQKVSRLFQYNGYSPDIYTEVLRTSRYINIRGLNLAIDIYRPAKNGVEVKEPYPAIVQNMRYQRRGRSTDMESINSWVKKGYVVAVWDPRGAGASFGNRVGDWSIEEARDGKEIIEWLAAQPYCNGKIGMWGISYMGGIQLMIAAQRPPHLVTIIPTVTTIDQFNRCPNGVVWTPPAPPKSIMYPLDTAGTSAKPPQNVDSDSQSVMLSAAVSEHDGNVYSEQEWIPLKTYRNQYKPEIKDMNFIVQSALTYRDDIKASGVSMYNMGGWYDAAPAQQLGAWLVWGGKVVIGPWGHRSTINDQTLVEHLRWFDYTLKGIENGINNESAISYYTINAPPGKEWKAASTWPLPEQKLTKYYLSGGVSGTSESKNDGKLSDSSPVSDGEDSYKVDYSIKYFEGKFRENDRIWDGDMEKGTDSKGLTYTSEPLESDLEITGHPVINLWVASTSTDGYFFAFLEEVDSQNNTSRYITNGMIRAAMRASSASSPYTEMGLPYHRCYDVDEKPLTPGQPDMLAFDLYPTSYIFKKGNRIRVTITCSFQDVYRLPPEDPAPVITLYRTKEKVSFIELPVIPN